MDREQRFDGTLNKHSFDAETPTLFTTATAIAGAVSAQSYAGVEFSHDPLRNQNIKKY